MDKVRVCRICKTARTDLDFYKGDKTNRCKACETARKRYERKKRSHAETDKRSWLKKTYNLTLEQYNSLYDLQKGVCAICGKEGKIKKGSLCIDHCHTSGEIRGLLCHSCNVGIGHFSDDPKLLLKAVKYLKNGKHRITSPENIKV